MISVNMTIYFYMIFCWELIVKWTIALRLEPSPEFLSFEQKNNNCSQLEILPSPRERVLFGKHLNWKTYTNIMDCFVTQNYRCSSQWPDVKIPSVLSLRGRLARGNPAFFIIILLYNSAYLLKRGCLKFVICELLLNHYQKIYL